MGIFGFLKKRRQEELPLPPPPSPPEIPTLLKGDIEPIQATDEAPHIEPLPELPAPTGWKPEIPAGEKEVKVFDKTIKPEIMEEEALEAPVRETIRVTPKPTFVAVEDYKRIINDTNAVRSKLMDAENFVRRLSDLKNEEERAFEKWRTQLEDVEKKLNYVDSLIARAQS